MMRHMTGTALVFVVIVGTIFLMAGLMVLRWMFKRWILRDAHHFSRADRVILFLAGVGTLCVAYGWFVEPYWPEVTHVVIESPKLAAGARPIRFVQISDMHSDARPRLEKRLPDLIRAEKPDVIVFTGDCSNSEKGQAVYAECMTKLAQIAPLYAVRGNWDRNTYVDRGKGVIWVQSRPQTVKIGSSTLWIGGEDCMEWRHAVKPINGIPQEAFVLYLTHTPDLFPGMAELNQVDLICCGHTHGGQVSLPFYGALMTLSYYGKRYEAGLYCEGATTLYVNRGLGMEGGVAPRVRFWSRPEITVFEIVPKR